MPKPSQSKHTCTTTNSKTLLYSSSVGSITGITFNRNYCDNHLSLIQKTVGIFELKPKAKLIY